MSDFTPFDEAGHMAQMDAGFASYRQMPKEKREAKAAFPHWEPKPDMCELHRCENPYIEGTGDFDEGHWVCDRDDCGDKT